VTVLEEDVGAVIARGKGYDAIVMDVDNGPDGVYRDNKALYQRDGVAAAFTALAPGGLYAVWSAFESPTYTRWLEDGGFDVELRTIHPARRAKHFIWFAKRPR
jgi:spermidine synthase